MMQAEVMLNLSIDKSNWTPVKFGDVVFEPKETAKDIYNEGIVHVVGLEHIDSENIHLTRSSSLEETTTFSKKFQKGDILFGRRRAYLKKAALASFDGICSGDITVFRAKKNLLPELLPFIVNNEKFFDHAIRHSAGGLSPRVKFKDLANYEFRLPPKDQQAQLVELLWDMDEVIERERVLMIGISRTIEPLIKQTIKSSRIDTMTLKDFIQSKEVDLLTGPFGTVLAANSYSSEGTPIINPTHISDGKIDADRGPFIPDSLLKKLSKYLMMAEDIVIGRKGEVGRSAIINSQTQRYMVGSDCIRLRLSSNRLLPKFLYIYLTLTVTVNWFSRYSYGTTMPGINEKTLLRLPIELPSRENQEQVIDIYDRLHLRLNILESKISASRALQKSLINQLF